MDAVITLAKTSLLKLPPRAHVLLLFKETAKPPTHTTRILSVYIRIATCIYKRFSISYYFLGP